MVLLLILITLPISTYAGIVKKTAIVGVTGKVIYKNKDDIARYAVRLVTSYKMAQNIAKKLADDIIEVENKGLKYTNYVVKEELIYRARTNIDKYNIPLMTLIELDWIDKEGKRNIKKDNKLFKDAVIYLTKRVDEKVNWNSEDQDNKCKDPNSSDALLKSKKYKKTSVNPFMVSEYGVAISTANEDSVVGDQLEHDHIPSEKAILLFMERKKNRVFTSKEKQKIKKNAITVTIPEKLHKSGRTYRGKNNLLKDLDSQDLFVAFFQDYAVHFMNLEFSKNRVYKKDSIFGKRDKEIKKEEAREKLIKSMIKHFKLNMELCLYESI